MKYTQAEADTIFDNGTNVTPGGGWIEREKWSDGYMEEDEDGKEVLHFQGWQYCLVDADGNPVEFLLKYTPEGADQTTRYNDGKARLITIDKVK